MPGTADIESLAVSGDRLYAVAQWPDRDATLVRVRIPREPSDAARLDAPETAAVVLVGADGDPDAALPEAVWAEARPAPCTPGCIAPPPTTRR